jgi:hypothetical protein
MVHEASEIHAAGGAGHDSPAGRLRALVQQIVHIVDPGVLVQVVPSTHNDGVFDVMLASDGREHHVFVDAARREVVAGEGLAGPPQGGAETEPTDNPDAADTIPPMMEAHDRITLDRSIDLVRHILAELDPAATAAFEEYHWHGELTLDVAISLHGHVHHYEVTAERAELFQRDHGMLHHDLEGVLIELRREARGAEHHEPAHQG